ncbi:unnamed protein product [Nezara viridula]|uniref:Uncharacterized protein n=1 Tax=Nezara viridula TaxID=85310 RepID=A0A9P0H1A0_NEZVI|nr:unnamed protein product [Nezara viridula]
MSAKNSPRKKRVLQEVERSPKTTLFAGAGAGLVVDCALFPLDTLKTRLQSQYGFWKSGGFRGVYKGIGPTAVGSAPCAASFFLTYNGFKYAIQPLVAPHQDFMVHMSAAAISEVVSCIVRVPTEIVKQRRQACIHEGSSLSIIRTVIRTEGPLGFYRGFWTTVLRDAPYSIIQFPLWEYFKTNFRNMRGGKEPTPSEGALCGAVAGAIAGAATTPLDVVKTRIMLSVGGIGPKRKNVKIGPIVTQIYKENGTMGFFAGFVPRVVWIFLGGGIFFGVYEKACVLIDGDS